MLSQQRFPKQRPSQNGLELASVVSFQIEVIWILLKKKEFTSFFLKISFFQTVFFVAISLLRGYFCKIVCYDQQAELNFHLLKSTKVEPLEVLVVLEVSKYGFHILWPLTAVFKTFR